MAKLKASSDIQVHVLQFKCEQLIHRRTLLCTFIWYGAENVHEELDEVGQKVPVPLSLLPRHLISLPLFLLQCSPIALQLGHHTQLFLQTTLSHDTSYDYGITSNLNNVIHCTYTCT